MSLFSKAEYREMTLPIVFVDYADEFSSEFLNLEVRVNIDGKNTYCMTIYTHTDEKIFNELVALLKSGTDRPVNVTVKVKKGKVKNAKIDLESLAQVYNDERFKELIVVEYDVSDESHADLILKSKLEGRA